MINLSLGVENEIYICGDVQKCLIKTSLPKNTYEKEITEIANNIRSALKDHET